MPKSSRSFTISTAKAEIEVIVAESIINGIVLPEGHGDLIDKGKFRKWIETQDGDRLMTEYYLDALEMQEKIVG